MFNKTENVTLSSGQHFYYILGHSNLRGFVSAITVLQIVLCIASFMGNAMIVVIMSRKKNRGHQTSILFTSLAISDSLVTIFGPFRFLLRLGFRVRFFSWTVYMPGLITVSISSVVQVSSWLLVLITIERVVCVVIPHRVYTIITARATIISVLVVCLFFPLFNGVFIFTTHLHEHLEDGSIVFYAREQVFADIYAWSEMLFKFLIPFAIILPSNAFIIFKLMRSNSLSTNVSYKRMQSVTKNVIIVCIAFIVTMSPRQVLHGLLRENIINATKEDVHTYALLFEVVELIQNCNAAINFYVYVLAGTKFRNDFLEVVSCLNPRCLR